MVLNAFGEMVETLLAEYEVEREQLAGDVRELLAALLDAGLIDRLLISQDRGWYDPAQPGGGTPKPYTYITDTFIPRMKAAGIDDAAIHRLTHVNPFRAFAR